MLLELYGLLVCLPRRLPVWFITGSQTVSARLKPFVFVNPEALVVVDVVWDFVAVVVLHDDQEESGMRSDR